MERPILFKSVLVCLTVAVLLAACSRESTTTPTSSPTATSASTATLTSAIAPSPLASPTPTPTPTPTPLVTPIVSPEPTPLPSPTASPSPTQSPLPTMTPVHTPTATPTPGSTATPTETPSPEPAPTETPSPEPTPTETPSPEPTPTSSPEITLTAETAQTSTTTMATSSVATSTPIPADTVSAISVTTAGPKRKCMRRSSKSLTAEQEQQIASLPWAVEDQWNADELRRLAKAAPEAFQSLVQWKGDSERVLSGYTEIAICDQEAAIRLLRMPFLDDVSFEDDYALRLLGDLAGSDLDGLWDIFSDPAMSDGISDGHVPLVWLYYLQEKYPESAALLNSLTWVQGIVTSANTRDGSIHDPKVDLLRELVSLALISRFTFTELLSKAWVKDVRALLNLPSRPTGCGRTWSSVIGGRLYIMTFLSDKATSHVLRMPFLDSIGQGEISTLGIIANLMGTKGYRWLLSQPVFRDGIKDDQRSAVALFDLEWRKPEAAETIRTLPWVQDGVDGNEEEGVLTLRELALESQLLFRALVDKHWIQDGLSYYENRAIEILTSSSLAREADNQTTPKVTPLALVQMPFMDSVEDWDIVALCSLNQLLKDTDSAFLHQVLSHPSWIEGITDEMTDVAASLKSIGKLDPELVGFLLDNTSELVKRRSVTTPISGKVKLSVIQLEPGDYDTLDLLEKTLRIQEQFIGVPFPKSYARVLVADVDRSGGRGGSDAQVIIDPGSEDDMDLISHELAHTYWHLDPKWIVEGAADFVSTIVRVAHTGSELPAPHDKCSLTDNIADLVRLEYELDFEILRRAACAYTLGEGIFLNLFQELEEETFKKAFGSLYLTMQNDLDVSGEENLDECMGIDRGVCYVKIAFPTAASPEEALIAEEIINRRYYGSLTTE